jgi:hypothetical protein
MRSSEFRGTLFRRKEDRRASRLKLGLAGVYLGVERLKSSGKQCRANQFWVNSEVCENTSVAITLGFEECRSRVVDA